MAGKKGRSGGHNAKTRGLHLVAGTHRPDRHGSKADAKKELAENKRGPVPSPPAGLDRVAAQEWRRMAKTLHARGDLATIDRAAFAAYCQAYSEFIAAEGSRRAVIERFAARLKADPLDGEASLVVAGGGTVIPGKDDTWVRNPAVVVANAAAKRMLEAAREFGMTPIARARRAAAGAAKPETPADFPEDLADEAAGN